MADREGFSLCDTCAERQGDHVEFDHALGKDCFICGGLTSRFPEIERRVVHRAGGYQFKTFSMGVIIPSAIQEREDQLRSDFKIRGGETIKSQLGREISGSVERKMKKRIDRRHPDITILVDIERDTVVVMAKSVFVYGRYTKPPGVSQRREVCDRCRGRGCGECQSGYKNGVSVEEVLENRLGKILRSQRAKFTWVGSEDPESTVFPPGRPFIAEVKNPRRRDVPRRLVARTGMGALKVTGLKVLKGRPISVPSFTFKTKAFILPEARIEAIPVGLAKAMRGAHIQFRNSKGKIVNKRVYSVKVEKRGAGLVADIKLDGGLPVKRLVSGGSVSLSLAELLKTPLTCQRFDILRVWESGSFKFGKI